MALLSVGSSQAQQANMDAKPPMAMPDMTKILTAPGVFGNFSTYKVRPDYYKLSMAERKGRLPRWSQLLRNIRTRSRLKPT
jgi:chlorite dismutase